VVDARGENLLQAVAKTRIDDVVAAFALPQVRHALAECGEPGVVVGGAARADVADHPKPALRVQPPAGKRCARCTRTEKSSAGCLHWSSPDRGIVRFHTPGRKGRFAACTSSSDTQPGPSSSARSPSHGRCSITRGAR